MWVSMAVYLANKPLKNGFIMRSCLTGSAKVKKMLDAKPHFDKIRSIIRLWRTDGYETCGIRLSFFGLIRL